MKHKKIITLALATALTASILTPSFANGTAASNTVLATNDTAIVSQEEAAMEFTTMLGTVQEVNADSILVKNDQTEMQFNLDENTWIVDGQAGIPTTLSELKGKEVVVSHSMATTMSIPAQSYAYSIITKGDVMPNYAVIEDVVSNEDGTVRLTIQNGGTWVTVANDAQLSPLRTRNIVTKEDLQKGAEVVLYYDTVAMSYPGQAYTDRVVLLEPAAESVESAKTEVAMVALRDAANELGLGIDWLQDSQTVILSKGAFSATVNIGSTSYGINKMAEELEQAAEIHDGRTYVPQSFVDSLKNALQ